jgi:hypothetical protein
LNNTIKQVRKVELVSASVPNTLYNISNGSNIISISNVSGDFLTFSIPDGFYKTIWIGTKKELYYFPNIVPTQSDYTKYLLK